MSGLFYFTDFYKMVCEFSAENASSAMKFSCRVSGDGKRSIALFAKLTLCRVQP